MGQYYSVFWKSTTKQPATVRLDYRQGSTGSQVLSKELFIAKPKRSNVTKFEVTGDGLIRDCNFETRGAGAEERTCWNIEVDRRRFADFDPDRFAREEHKQHSFLWAPFGGGAHKCIGLHFADMLFKCALAKILASYRIRFVKADQFPGRIQHFPFAKPMDNLPLVLEPLA